MQLSSSQDEAGLSQFMNNEDIAGDTLFSGLMGYFSNVDEIDQIATKILGDMVVYRMPSYGAYVTKAAPHYFFGIVRSVSFMNVVMDVDRLLYQAEAKDGDIRKRYAYMKQAGAMGSALEHAIPEILFADPTKPLTDPSQPQGVSAVKALSIAAAQGQKIYTINAQNQANLAQAISQLQTDVETRQEILDALNAGKEVTFHPSEILIDGWKGMGYIISDPETAAGAYKISGGQNGGAIKNQILFMAGFLKQIWDKLPAALKKAIGGIFMMIISQAQGLYDLLTKCKSMTAAISIALVFLIWNVMFLQFLMLLVSTGAGALAITVLTMAELAAEQKLRAEALKLC